ncbi:MULTISPECIES: chorismate mutase [Actinoallomurus]|uniref:chorismate mutase n=1 Tax=Actinoallomurus TaxID=667113 RepID=UPI002092EC56|nr:MULTISPECIES: chorismate mutase [Actinoallomurus]MCO5967260.1 chorismate mutase [Actinoallomurus soli]MCO5999600.1 chorismate mutase [Actinoallomurus rhizosphaericola]
MDPQAKAALLAALTHDDVPETIPDARAAIDRIDAALATLLERRAELAATVQRLKPVGGFAGRDPRREREIVEAMASLAPRLGADRLARIMTAVIEAGLEAAEDRDLSSA